MPAPQIHYDGPDWRNFSLWLTAEMGRLRGLNDNPLDAAATSELRGQIKLAKRLLALPALAAQERAAGSAQDRPFGDIEV